MIGYNILNSARCFIKLRFSYELFILIKMALSSIREDVLMCFEENNIRHLETIFETYVQEWIFANKSVFFNTNKILDLIYRGELTLNNDALKYLPASSNLTNKKCMALK